MAGGENTKTTIECNNPLYLHPSDGPNTLKVEPQLIGAGDYRPWKRSMEISLATKRKLGFVTGALTKSSTDSVLKEAWEACNNMVTAWLLNNMTESLRRSVMYMKSAKEIWLSLRNRFTVSNGNRKYRLNKAIYEVKQSERPVSEYYTELRVLWEEIESMNDYPPITSVNSEITAYVEAIEQQKEEQKLFQFLNGLDSGYGALRSQILLMSELPTVETATSMVQQEESQNEVLGKEKEENVGIALYSKNDSKLFCTVCKKNNHTAEKCWFKIGFPAGNGKNKQYNKNVEHTGENRGGYGRGKNQGGYGGFNTKKKNANNALANMGNAELVAAIAQQLQNLMKSGGSSSNAAVKQPDDTDEEIDTHFAGMISCHFVKNMNNTWIIDSGALDHMIANLDKLHDVKQLSHKPKINLPNGGVAYVTHVGDTWLSDGIKLKDVLFVPEFKQNLLSVQKLCQSDNCCVLFHKDYCVLQDCTTQRIKDIGTATGGLYYLQNQPNPSQDSRLLTYKNKTQPERQSSKLKANVSQLSFLCVNNTDDDDCVNYKLFNERVCNNSKSFNAKLVDYSLWHVRLGHAPFSKLKHISCLKDQLKKPENDICISCPMAKLTKLPYTLSDTKVAGPFDLIHIDIWGPYRVPYKEKYRFFLTIVDDFTRATWVHLLKNKSDSFETIKNFCVYARNQFDRNVRIIRSDNALEFKDKDCVSLFTEKGIIHQTSCVDRPQQNGVVERKHRHLLEMSRALRFGAGLPLSYWGDCVLIAAHLINRLPSSVINNRTPYEMMFHKVCNYHELRSFGCLAMAYNPDREKDKFKARVVPCLFLGYPATQKGYKLESLIDKRQFVSRDVKFYEHVFPLKNNTYKNIVNPIPIDLPIQHVVEDTYLDHINTSQPTLNEPESQHFSPEPQNFSPAHIPSPEPLPIRKSNRISKTPAWMNDYVTPYSHNTAEAVGEASPVATTSVNEHFANMVGKIIDTTEPRSYYEAATQPGWIEAMNKEIQALVENETWEITTLPPGRKAIGCRWVYKTKYKADGSIERKKARLVIQGCNQK